MGISGYIGNSFQNDIIKDEKSTKYKDVKGTVVIGAFDFDYTPNSRNGSAKPFRWPPGWLLALKYVTNYAHVRMIVPSKMGHQSANQYVNPYFYDIRKFQKALN